MENGELRIRVNLFHPPDPRSVLFVLAFCLLSFGRSYASDSTRYRQNMLQTVGSDIATAWSDIGPFFTAPLRFDGTDWRNAAIVLGGTGLLMPLDSSARHAALTSSHSSSVTDLASFTEQYGSTIGIGVAGVTYLAGLAFGSEKVRSTGRELIETLALAGATTTVLKYVAGRSRPFTEAGPYSFHPFSFDDTRFSMPSGHTTVAFCISSVLAARIDHPVVTVALYGLATCTAIDRIYHDKHWLSDTFLGAAIATTTGLWVVHRDEQRAKNDGAVPPEKSSIEIQPSLGGVSLTYRF
jgi:membrane-associated phospholipid phosphatase